MRQHDDAGDWIAVLNIRGLPISTRQHDGGDGLAVELCYPRSVDDMDHTSMLYFYKISPSIAEVEQCTNEYKSIELVKSNQIMFRSPQEG